MSSWRLFVALLLLSGPLASTEKGWSQRIQQSEKRAVTVSDAVAMKRVGEPLLVGYTGIGPAHDFAVFSPDGKHFAFVVTTGDLQRNANNYSLLVYRTADVFRSAIPKEVAYFSSASNRAGISNLRWLDDNDTIFFLGSEGEEPTQLYSIRCSSGDLKKLTKHKTSLRSFAISAHGSTLAFLADKPERDIETRAIARYGLAITTESLQDLMRGKITSFERELFIVQQGARTETRLQTVGSLDGGINDLFLSRDGRHLILKTGISELPKNWKQYEDQTIQTAFRRVIPPGASSGLLRYEWIDLSTNQSTPILEAPAPFSSDELLWAPDSRSVLLGGVYLPLDSNDVGRQKERKSAKYVIEIRLPTRKVIEVRAGELIPVHWDQQANVVQFRMRSNQSQAVSERKDVYYQKVQDEWKQVLSSSSGQPKHLPDIVVDQDLNIPPRIVAINGATRQTILDLNPQFAGLAFGRVEPIEWPDGSGETMNGGLYLPPNYDPSHRYPLVIQTHGFDPHAFWIDGPWSTAFAAQPLAGRGIVVLQINDSVESWRNTSVESERIMRAYESAIDFLDQKGIIDPRRVGIVGFSRTCLYVKYTLTHSRRRFAAAVASDGFDGGYFEYVAAGPLAKSEMEAVAGALPFGPELGLWMRKAPGFLLDKVQTPIQLHANAAASLLEQWEWFAGLKRLGKAVDLLYIPADVHILMKPWDRMAAEQASVDWFCFWLKGEENPNPEKATQYVRWRQLRALTRSPSE